MGRLLTWLSNAWNGFIGFFTDAWNGLVGYLNDVWRMVVDIGLWFWNELVPGFIVWFLDVLFDIGVWLVGLLPRIPEMPQINNFSILAFANQYIALNEAIALAAIWGTIFGGVGVYKLIKLVRGGG